MSRAVLDLRTYAQREARTAQGVGIFEDAGRLWLGPWQRHDILGSTAIVWRAPTSVAGYVDLGSDPIATKMSTGARRELARQLNFNEQAFPDESLAHVLAYYILGSLADPTGVVRQKPLRMGKAGLELYLGSFGRVLAEPLSTNHPNYDATIAVRKVDYDRNAKAGVPQEALERWTGATMRKFLGRIDSGRIQEFVPLEYLDGRLGQHSVSTPRTTYGDTFQDTNGTSLDAHTPTGANAASGWTETDGTEWQIDNNQADTTNHSGSSAFARIDDDLSDDDTYAEAILRQFSSGGSGGSEDVGVGTRCSASDNFQSYAATFAIVADEVRIIEYPTLSASGTELAATAHTTATGETIKVEANGSTIRSLIDNSQIDSVTDTTITGNLRGGLRNAFSFWAKRAHLDDFVTADIVAGGGPPVGGLALLGVGA